VRRAGTPVVALSTIVGVEAHIGTQVAAVALRLRAQGASLVASGALDPLETRCAGAIEGLAALDSGPVGAGASVVALHLGTRLNVGTLVDLALIAAEPTGAIALEAWASTRSGVGGVATLSTVETRHTVARQRSRAVVANHRRDLAAQSGPTR
jgi:hypothetical protein